MADDKRLERIELKLDDTNDHLAKIDITLSAQHISLREHIRRTTILEESMKPVTKHINMVQGAAALIALLATIAGIVAIFK